MGHFPFLSLIMGKEGVGVAVAIKHSSNFRISVVKTAFWFCLRLHRLLSSENQIVRVASRSRRTKPSTKHGNMLCDWFILLLLLLTLAIWFSLDHKQWSHKQSWKKMEKIWFFLLQFRRTYDSAYDSDFLFSLNHKRSYNCAYNSDANSVASETSPQRP